jgi:SAM-dependent methyltransferase
MGSKLWSEGLGKIGYGHYSNGILRTNYLLRRYLRDFIFERLGQYVISNTMFLDVGCGDQPWRQYVDRLGGQYVGTDMRRNGGATALVIGKAECLPFLNSSFDVILCSEVLEHVIDARDVFGELSRVTRSGGKIIITTPFHYPLHGEPLDFCRMTEYQLRQFASENGLVTKECCRAGNSLEVIATICEDAWTDTSGTLWGKFKNIFVRLLINPIAIIAGKLGVRHASRRTYLNTMCVFEKA